MAVQQHLIRFGPYRLDEASGQLWRYTQLVKLPPKTAAVLGCLSTQAGQVVTKDTLLETVWAETAVSEGVLAVCIRDLRRALGDDPKHPRYIETVHKRGYRFVAPVERLAATLPGGRAVTPRAVAPAGPAGWLVGREAELAQVQACLARARGGQRQVLFVTGEAGIGKTALVETWGHEVAAPGGGWVGWGQCVEAYGPGPGSLPLLEALGRLCRGPAGATVLAQLQQWAPTWLAHLSVLPAVEQARLRHRPQGATRARLLQELAEALEALTQAQLGGLVLEDLHWSDPSMASVVGMEFAAASVAAGLATSLERPEVVCEVLARRGQFLEASGLAVWPDGTVSGQYCFRHAVYQQVLYRRLATARRVQGHRRIGARLEAGYGAGAAEIAAELAEHFARGQDTARPCRCAPGTNVWDARRAALGCTHATMPGQGDCLVHPEHSAVWISKQPQRPGSPGEAGHAGVHSTAQKLRVALRLPQSTRWRARAPRGAGMI